MNPWLAARNILAIRLDNTGDVIMLGPALRAIKAASPEARITLLTTPAGAAAAPLLPWVDHIVEHRPIWQALGDLSRFEPAQDRELIARLAALKFDAALIFTSFSQTPHVPAYVCYLAGITLRAGESKDFGGGVLTSEVLGTPEAAHQVDRNLRLVESLGFAVEDRRLAVSIPDAAHECARKLLIKEGIEPGTPFILVHPGASAGARRYPAECFGVVARLLTDHGWPVVITGTEREATLIDQVQAEAPRAVRLARVASLPEYAALTALAGAVVCNNSLPLHMADAAGTPLVVLFAGTDYEEQWGPRVARHRLLRRPTACHPCYLFDCPIGQQCLDIPAEEVFAAIEDVLAGSPPASLLPTVGRSRR